MCGFRKSAESGFSFASHVAGNVISGARPGAGPKNGFGSTPTIVNGTR
jgi:hypothetical protein